jgi:hypothetical protein
MKRDELLVPGQYAALPKAMLADPSRTPAEKIVLMALIDRLGKNDTTWPGLHTLAEDAGLSRNGVQKILGTLAEAGIIKDVGISRSHTTIWEIVPRPQGGTQSGPVHGVDGGQRSGPPVHGVDGGQQSGPVHTVDQGGQPSGPVGANGVDRGGQQSGPELLNLTTEPTTQGNTEALRAEGADAPVAGAALRATPSTAALVTGGAGEVQAPQDTTQTAAEQDVETVDDFVAMAGEIEEQLTTPAPVSLTPPWVSSPTPTASNAPGTPPGPPAGKVKRGNRPKLTPADIEVICASPKAMELWLTFGIEKVRHPDQAMPPSNMNWRTQIKDPTTSPVTAESIGASNWTIPQFVGFYWYRVSLWRAERGISLGMPPEKLFGMMKNMRSAVGGNWKLFLYINALTFLFDMFCVWVGKIGDNAILDEMMLCHSSFKNAVIQYNNSSDEQQEKYRQDFAQAAHDRMQMYRAA